MYGKAAIDFPQRIVCLTAETAEIAFLVGAGDRVVGVPGTARRPEAVRERARVGGFTTFRTDRILALEPDLVLAFSDLQKDIVAELIAAGVAVLCTNQRSFDDVLRAILTLGGALGCAEAARSLVQDMRDEIKQVPRVLGGLARSAARLLRGVDGPARRRHPLGVGADRDRRRPGRLRGVCARGAAPRSASSRRMR